MVNGKLISSYSRLRTAFCLLSAAYYVVDHAHFLLDTGGATATDAKMSPEGAT
jgi:hypothetical protein